MWELVLKKTEWQRIDAVELWYWRRLLNVPWTARRFRHSILEGINLVCSLKGLMLKLKLRSFGHLMQRADSLEKTLTWERLKVGGEVDGRGWDGWMASPTHWVWVSVNFGSWWWTGRPGMLQSMDSQRFAHDWATEVNWSTSRSVMSDSLWPHGVHSPWNSLGQNTRVSSLSLFEGIFPSQGSIPGLWRCRPILYQLSHQGNPRILEQVLNQGLLCCRWVLYQLRY